MLIQKGPYLQDVKKQSVIVMWETDVDSEGEVLVYDMYHPHVPVEKCPIKGEHLTFPAESGLMHAVTIEGLSSGHDYCYEVVAKTKEERVTSGRFSFRTAPEEGTAISFVLTAEHGGVENTANPFTGAIVERIAKEHPDFIMSVGDIVQNGTRSSDWETYFFYPFEKLLHTTPFYPCVGNHEVFTGGGMVPEEEQWRYHHYEKYFAFPRHYSFDYGDVHICVLDCPDMISSIERLENDAYFLKVRDDLKETAQYRFLEEDLAQTKAKWKFVVFHYPPYTSAIYDVRELQVLAPVFEKYGVDVVFNSHSIIYERSHPIKQGRVDKDGILYILVGGYGEFEDWIREKKNGLSAKVASRPCYVYVTVTPFSMELQAIDYEGKLFDTMRIEKE